MRLVHFAIIVLAGFTLALPAGPGTLPALGQEAEAEEEAPPIPRPRPTDRETAPTFPEDDFDAPAPPSATPATDAIDALTGAPQPVSLSATISSGGAPVAEGLVWRVFDTTPDESGELSLVARSEDAAPTIELAPGVYVVHVAYGRAQTSDTVTVGHGANAATLALEAGALRLNAMVEGEEPIPPELLRFDIHTSGPEASRMPVAEGLAAHDIVTLNAGTYHVVSHFGSINAVVRANLRVEPGQLADATLYHNASQVSFRLVSEPGGEAIADVEWTVRDPAGAVLFSELGAFPATVLAAGDYIVLAKQGQSVFNREFEVRAGPASEIEVLTQVY